MAAPPCVFCCDASYSAFRPWSTRTTHTCVCRSCRCGRDAASRASPDDPVPDMHSRSGRSEACLHLGKRGCSVVSHQVDGYPTDTSAVGLFKKHQLWKLKAGRVVSHGFRHAEFNGARKNRFQALLGVANLISNFRKCMGGQKIKMQNHIKRVPKICKIMRGFHIWPQNSNRITFDPFFGQKQSEIGKISDLAHFGQFFGQKGVISYSI